MATFKVNKTKDYTIMSNYHLKDKNITLKAKGLLSLMLSLPDDWDYSINGLAAISKEGRDSIMATLNELEENKYLYRDTYRNEKGQYESIYNIYEQPTDRDMANKESVDVKDNNGDFLSEPSGENRVGKTESENPIQINIKEENTKTNNKENIIKEIIAYLNEKVGTDYRSSSKKTQSLINARLNEGFTIDDFRKVINIKTKDWLKDDTMSQYLRPETLFGTKFESYLNQKDKAFSTYGENTSKTSKFSRTNNDIISHKYTDDELNNVYDNLETIDL